MRYVDHYNYDQKTIDLLLKSGKPEDRISALITTVYSSNDYFLSEKIVSESLSNDNVHVRAKALLFIGDLVRVFGKINMDHLDLLETILGSEVESEVEDVLEDIWIFYHRNIGHVEMFKSTHPLSYKFWMCNLVTDEYSIDDSELGKKFLRLLIQNCTNEKVLNKISQSIQFIDLED